MTKETIFDNYGKCPKCGEKNQIIIKDFSDNIICECETQCFICKHEDYWAYGHYESNRFERIDNELDRS